MANKWTREKIILPKTLKPKERIKIAEIIIEHIVTRSANGLDRNNKKFAKYSDSYAEKKGVGVSDVDLILTGEMLDSLEIVSTKKSGEIIIGYIDPSDDLAGKVEGNRIGSYGGEPNKKKARDFLGIDADELEILVGAFEGDIDLGQDSQGFNTQEILDELLRDVLS
jgi:hypothetical protein